MSRVSPKVGRVLLKVGRLPCFIPPNINITMDMGPGGFFLWVTGACGCLNPLINMWVGEPPHYFVMPANNDSNDSK